MSTADNLTVERGSDPYVFYRRNLLSPARVRELSRLRPLRVVVDTLGCWCCIVAALALVAFWPSWWTTLLAIPVIGTRYYALFIIGHDGLHRRLFRGTRANDLFADLFIFGPVGAITRINNKNHLSHHQHLASADDPDRHKHGCFNKSQRPELVGYLTGLTSVFSTIGNVFIRKGKTRGATGEVADPQATYTARDLAILAGWLVVLIGGLTVAIGWWAYPVLWLVPLYVFFVLGDNFRSFAEHSHPEADAKADEHRLITYLANPVELWFFAPMNMNYHAAHHLWPSIPYYNLPQADREVRQMAAIGGLEWRASYVGYLWRYFRALPLEECRAAPSGMVDTG
jgi:fatty acid desaturase